MIEVKKGDKVRIINTVSNCKAQRYSEKEGTVYMIDKNNMLYRD